MKKRLFFLPVLLFALAWSTAMAAHTGTAAAVPESGMPVILSESVHGEEWLFLPSGISAELLRYTLNGQPAVAEMLPGGNASGEFRIRLTAENGETAELRALQDTGLRSIFLMSDDADNAGRSYIEAEGQKHTNQASGRIAVLNASGETDYEGALSQIRGRGNATWLSEKKPYQIKLKEKTDLMCTGEGPHKTYTLLTAAQDDTLIKNRICLDLGRELGLSETPYTEPVDLYYDGEYMGAYVLSEKVQVGRNRIEGTDYEKAQPQTDTEPVRREGTTPGGKPMSWVEGASDPEDIHAATWYAELDNQANISDPCSFELEGIRWVDVKCPENASEKLMTFISGRIEALARTLRAGGADPETGLTLSEQADVDGFAAIVLLNELTSCYDGMKNGNGYFVMHEGEDLLSPGPAWDFDLTFRDAAAGWRNKDGWLQDFYRVPEFRAAYQRLVREKAVPLVRQILLGTGVSGSLKPIREYAREAAVSNVMNSVRWNGTAEYADPSGRLESWLAQRTDWLAEQMDRWDDPARIDLYAETQYTLTEDCFKAGGYGFTPAAVSDVCLSQLTEADEENYALWEMTAVVAPAEGFSAEEPLIVLNGVPVQAEPGEDGTWLIRGVFEDASYRPTDYDGTDIGYIYEESAFRANYPALSERFGSDSEGLMAYFMEEGIYEGLKGNAYFDAVKADTRLGMQDLFGGALEEYYYQFMDYGYMDWIRSMPAAYDPVFIPADEWEQ